MCNMRMRGWRRCCRKAEEAGTVVDDVTLATADLRRITHESELTLAAKLAEWPRLVETAARANEPHRIAFYLYELAADFHALWNRGQRSARTAIPARRPGSVSVKNCTGPCLRRCNCNGSWYSWSSSQPKSCVNAPQSGHTGNLPLRRRSAFRHHKRPAQARICMG